jgi:hypothetical protein
MIHPMTWLTRAATAAGWRSHRRARSRTRRDRARLLSRAMWSRSAAACSSSIRWFASSKYGQLPGGCGAQPIAILLVFNTDKQSTVVFTGLQPVN